MSSTRLLLEKVSVWRNPVFLPYKYPVAKAIAAEPFYLLIVPYAIVEAAIAQIVKGVAFCARRHIQAQKYQAITEWATSSIYCTIWAVYAGCANLFVRRIYAKESELITALTHSAIFKPRSNPSINTRWTSTRSMPILPTIISFDARPPAVEPRIADLLRNIRLGPNAKKYCDAYERVFRNLPEPTQNELASIGTQISTLVTDRCSAQQRITIKAFLDKIAQSAVRTQWESRFIKMVVSVHNATIATGNPSDLEILKQAIKDSWENCINRKTAEFESLTCYYITCSTFFWIGNELNNLTPADALFFDMSQERMKHSDIIIPIYCPNSHNAASKVYFRRKLKNHFGLPETLSSLDPNYESFAMKQQEPLIIEAFDKVYTFQTIFVKFNELIYPRTGDRNKFLPSMFADWLSRTGRMNAEAFENDEMTRYRPELLIEFLLLHGLGERITAST